jgi:hypothetical protein
VFSHAHHRQRQRATSKRQSAVARGKAAIVTSLPDDAALRGACSAPAGLVAATAQ